MRADRLVSLMLLLRQRGRMTAASIARELEVSTRTVLRDIEALSAAGVPVYAERGRSGGFALLDGFRTRLAGLTHDEALALLAAGASRRGASFGFGTSHAAAIRKIVDTMTDEHRTRADEAARRLLIEPDTDLLERRVTAEKIPEAIMSPVRRAVLGGHRLSIEYAAAGRAPDRRTVDPVGLVTVRGTGYLLATRSGEDRTYRLSRIRAAECLREPAERREAIDLEQIWRERGARFRTGGATLTVVLRIEPGHRSELLRTVVDVAHEESEADGRLRFKVTFQDEEHAHWAVWQLGTGAEVLEPASLRTALRETAERIAEQYAESPVDPSSPAPGIR